jgi:uncharacterized protein (TIGR03067 family)
MKWRALIMAAAFVGLAADATDDANKKDLERLHGTWRVQQLIADGRDVLSLPVNKKEFMLVLVCEGDRAVIKFGKEGRPPEQERTCTITLDATKNPKEIDLTSDKNGKGAFVFGENKKGRAKEDKKNEGGKEETYKGIYEVQGDTLKICIFSEEEDQTAGRPKELAAEKDSKTLLLVFKREKK